MTLFENFDRSVKAAVIGASGGIGKAFVEQLQQEKHVETVYALSRSGENHIHIDFEDETSIEKAAQQIDSLDIVIVAGGLLHHDTLMPEKALKDINAQNFQKILNVNTIGPALIAKHFIPLLPKKERGLFAALSARVGSISDNHLGGWYAYRASKAALNMILKNTAIETARTRKNAVIIGLHPGTVDTNLSEPFQGFVKPGKLFTPDYAATEMLKVLDSRTPEHSGHIFAYDGQEVLP